MLPVTDELVDQVATQLSDGGWRYTLRQLYYAVCRSVEPSPARTHTNARGAFGLGVLLVLLGLILIALRPLFIGLTAAGLVLIAVAALLRMRPRPAPSARLLALSFAEFAERFGSRQHQGLISDDTGAGAVDSTAPLVVCDTAETATLVAANLQRAGLRAAPRAHAALEPPLDGMSVVALHDASPAGCALSDELRALGAVAVADAGLRPGDVAGQDRQYLEGAPAQVGAGARRTLLDAEIRWLEAGRRAELAVLTPAEVMERVAAALAQVSPGRAAPRREPRPGSPCSPSGAGSRT